MVNERFASNFYDFPQAESFFAWIRILIVFVWIWMRIRIKVWSGPEPDPHQNDTVPQHWS